MSVIVTEKAAQEICNILVQDQETEIEIINIIMIKIHLITEMIKIAVEAITDIIKTILRKSEIAAENIVVMAKMIRTKMTEIMIILRTIKIKENILIICLRKVLTRTMPRVSKNTIIILILLISLSSKITRK